MRNGKKATSNRHMINVEAFYDSRTSTLTYCVFDQQSKDAVVIDPVLDYDPASSTIWTESVDRVIGFLSGHELSLRLVLETHAHADHLSGAQEIKRRIRNVAVAVGESITFVQQTFKLVFGMSEEFSTDGSQFDRLLKDGERIKTGTLEFEVLFTPGHTPACVCYLFDGLVFTGDALFMPDSGTGRCDFPMGDSETLFDSISSQLYSLPDATRVFVGHDYQPDGRAVAYETTIGDEKQSNIHLTRDTKVEDFVRFRRNRDKKLSPPALLFQSVQVNIDAGAMPTPESDQKRFLKIPVNIFKPEVEGKLTFEPV